MRLLNPFAKNDTTKDVSILQSRMGLNSLKTVTFKQMLTEIDPELFVEHIIPQVRIMEDGSVFFRTSSEVRTYIDAKRYRWLIFDRSFRLIRESNYEYAQCPNYDCYVVCVSYDLRNMSNGKTILYIIDPKNVMLRSDTMMTENGDSQIVYYPENTSIESSESYRFAEIIYNLAV